MLRRPRTSYLGIIRRASGFNSIKEVIDALKYVDGNVASLFQKEQLRRESWDYTEEQEGGRIAVSASKILKELSKSDQYEIVNSLEEKIIEGKIS